MRTIALTMAALLLAGHAVAEDAPRPQTFDSAGVAIQYTVEGKGPPVVLIHGLHSSADMNWRMPGTIKLLAANYQVMAMDVRGHGGSGKPDKAEAYGVQMAEDVVRLLDHLKIEKAHVVGYSMGGMIAMKLAVKHPDRLLSLTLGGMGWLRDGSALAGFWSAMPERQAGGGASLAGRSLGELAVTEDEVKAIRVPVAILVGDRDPCRRLYVAPLEQLRKDWPVTVIEGAGHLNCIMKPQFKEELKKWLDKQGLRAHAASAPKGCTCDQCLITRWRQHKVTVEKAEQEIGLAKLNSESKGRWGTFVSNLRPGYELWFYTSPGPTWEKLMGKEGYAIFDGPCLVADYLTKEN